MSLLDSPLREQASAVAGGDADPTELLEAALARIQERNPAVNAIVDTFPEESRRMLGIGERSDHRFEKLGAAKDARRATGDDSGRHGRRIRLVRRWSPRRPHRVPG